MLAVSGNGNLYIPLLAAAIAFPRLQVDPTFWLLTSLPLAAAAMLRWGQLDNHQYLFMYWCLVLYLAVGTTPATRKSFIAVNAQALIALCMGFSVLAKILSPSYLDGSFFKYTLLLDPRFSMVSEGLAGMTPEQLETNRSVATGLRIKHLEPKADVGTQLETSPLLPVVASAMAWWTIGIEAIIALAFALPSGVLMRRFRNALLLIFLLTSYAVVPVQGFAWILMNLGIAQCGENERKTRFAYFAAFAITCMSRQVYDGVLVIFAPF
jgi:hypothetical protein